MNRIMGAIVLLFSSLLLVLICLTVVLYSYVKKYVPDPGLILPLAIGVGGVLAAVNNIYRELGSR